MAIRSLWAFVSRTLLISVVATLALGVAVPAQAHHQDAKQNKQIKKLFNKTSQLSPDGWDFTGFVWSIGCEGPTDNAEFYQWEDTEFFFMECGANSPTSQSIDALTTNRASRTNAVGELLQSRG